MPFLRYPTKNEHQKKEKEPMKIDVRALLAGECRALPIKSTLAFLEQDENGCGIVGDYRFPAPLKVEGEIVGTAGYLRLTACLSAPYESFCARCLSDVSGEFSFTFERTVSTRSQLAELDEAELDDYVLAENGFVEPDELLLEFFELSLPLRVLCQEDCRGLCQHCGQNLNHGECTCQKTEVDPRLAPLQKWLETHKDEE